MSTSSDSECPDHLSRLIGIIARLRDPEHGCPWDRVQTHRSLRRFLVEETAEYLEAVEADDQEGMRDELGDILLQVVLNAQIAAENGHFSLQDVAQSEADKMLRRHPHVFAPDDRPRPDSDRDLRRQWDAIKAQEKAGQRRQSALDGVPRCLSALARAQKLLGKAGKTGFEWPDFAAALGKVEEELAEVREAAAGGDREALAEELGDLLFTVVNLCRWQQLQAEDVLEDAMAKFRRRFKRMEAALSRRGEPLAACSPAALLRAWAAAKEQDGEP